jgi:hypothetical protein
VPISRRGLIAAGLALTTVGAVGIASTLNAAAQVIDSVGPPPAVSAAGPVAEHRTPPPPLSRSAVARGFSASSVPDSEATTSLEPTPEYAPKGLPGVKAAGGRTASAQGVQALAAPAVTFHYASASQHAVSDGTQATITIAKPKLDDEDFHSLAEVAAQSADGQQIVEVGWTVDRVVNGDDSPHLFVYRWVDRKESCYNACGFVPYGSTIKPGAVLPTGVAKLFAIKHFGDAWWINYDNQWIGYYPDSLWDGRFTRTGLTQWFGEVAAADATPCTDMGNGKAASNKNAAAITDIGFFNGPAPAIAAGATSIYYSVAGVTDNAYRFGGKGAC